MAETTDAASQGTLAMLSTYTSGIVATLSGCVALVTDIWQDPALPIGISMVVAVFLDYFSYFGVAIIVVSTFLFAFGTIVGNTYNGSHCFSYLSGGKKVWGYFAASALMIVLGAVSEVTTIWSLSDLVLAFMAIPHMGALILHAFKKPSIDVATA